MEHLDVEPSDSRDYSDATIMTSRTDKTARQFLTDASVCTPAFIYDEQAIVASAQRLGHICEQAGCCLLYAMKPMNLPEILDLLTPHVEGLSASSLFEATTAREVLGARGSVHIATPGFRPDEIDLIAEICDYVTLNSLSQWSEFGRRVADNSRCGLRVNPKISFVDDERYDPCRRHSKLGVPIDDMASWARDNPDFGTHLNGLHFHTNCDSPNATPLWQTVQHLDARIPHLLDKIDWINLGGGYLFSSDDDVDLLIRIGELLRDKWGLKVFIEPGAAVVRHGCCLVATVIDMFDSEGESIAILDTSVNHMPEVFEYQFRPEILDADENADHSYLLAGSTCLAGDIFGHYSFRTPLKIGSRIVFQDMGAYTTVKWNCFNGVTLPDIYSLSGEAEMSLKRKFTYDDYTARFGGMPHAAV